MFMTSGGYKHVFGEQHQSNAYMVRLKNHETSNVESRSAKLHEAGRRERHRAEHDLKETACSAR
jgi:hypothetical protein